MKNKRSNQNLEDRKRDICDKLTKETNHFLPYYLATGSRSDDLTVGYLLGCELRITGDMADEFHDYERRDEAARNIIDVLASIDGIDREIAHEIYKKNYKVHELSRVIRERDNLRREVDKLEKARDALAKKLEDLKEAKCCCCCRCCNK